MKYAISIFFFEEKENIRREHIFILKVPIFQKLATLVKFTAVMAPFRRSYYSNKFYNFFYYKCFINFTFSCFFFHAIFYLLISRLVGWQCYYFLEFFYSDVNFSIETYFHNRFRNYITFSYNF